METFWTAFAAISTFLAVIVALGIAIFQNRLQRKVELKVSLSTEGCYSKEKSSIIVISNIGNSPETITRLKLGYTNN